MRPLVKDDDEDANNGKGIFNHTEDMEFMEMAGKKMYSKDLGPNLDKDNDENNSSEDDNQ